MRTTILSVRAATCLLIGIVVFALSLIGGATVGLAQSSRDLTEPTGTQEQDSSLCCNLGNGGCG